MLQLNSNKPVTRDVEIKTGANLEIYCFKQLENLLLLQVFDGRLD